MEDKQKRKPPVHIPLPFERAVEGLLGVNPKELPAKKKPAQAKRRTKKKR
jgi:hypothetical protein